MTFFIWVHNWRDVSHGNRESPGVKARKWGLRCWRPRCCEPRSAGWREDDRYSAETLLHRASAVRKLSGCHDSIPTGYELIWTRDNTTVSFCRKEKPPHSHLGELPKLNAQLEAPFTKFVLTYCANSSRSGCMCSSTMCVFHILRKNEQERWKMGSTAVAKL